MTLCICLLYTIVFADSIFYTIAGAFRTNLRPPFWKRRILLWLGVVLLAGLSVVSLNANSQEGGPLPNEVRGKDYRGCGLAITVRARPGKSPWHAIFNLLSNRGREGGTAPSPICHCEERSDVAIS